MATAGLPHDPFGAFCRDNHVALDHTGDGVLTGLRFAVKDVFDIAGSRTGFGHPDWLRTHPPATATAPAVARLLAAGADLVGKTHCDELTYSLTGRNPHYGTPVNPAAPDRIPGGSSSGSACAVAGGMVDFALGTDCGGSVRLPASYCGVLGLRPTHGRIAVAGVVPLAPTFDVVGWFTRDAGVLERVGRVLLDEDNGDIGSGRLLLARDAFELVEPAVAEALRGAVSSLAAGLGQPIEVVVAEDGLPAWLEVFRVIQAGEIWANHGAWIREVRPRLGRGVCERLDRASRVTTADAAVARAARDDIATRLHGLLGPGDVLCLPTSPQPPPQKDEAADPIEDAVRRQAMCLLCVAGLGGLPQINLPLARLGGLPLGLSLIGARGADARLLARARRIMARAG